MRPASGEGPATLVRIERGAIEPRQKARSRFKPSALITEFVTRNLQQLSKFWNSAQNNSGTILVNNWC